MPHYRLFFVKIFYNHKSFDKYINISPDTARHQAYDELLVVAADCDVSRHVIAKPFL